MQARYQAQLHEEVLDIYIDEGANISDINLCLYCNPYCIESTTNTHAGTLIRKMRVDLYRSTRPIVLNR